MAAGPGAYLSPSLCVMQMSGGTILGALFLCFYEALPLYHGDWRL